MLCKIIMVAILIFKINRSVGSTRYLAKNYRQCSTSTQTGECIALKECPILLKMFMNFNQLTDIDKQHIKDSQCGYDGSASDQTSKVLVCCPSEQKEDDESSIDEVLIENVGIDNSHCGWIKKGDTKKEVEPMSSNSGSEFPWMALIEYVDVRDATKRGLNCSGTLINNRYILTAAHCVNNIHWRPHRILLGHWDPNDLGCLIHAASNTDCSPTNLALAVEVEKIIIHPNYPVDVYHDLALVRMKTNIEYTDYIRPICLPFGFNLKTTNLTNILAEFASWGQAKRKSAASGVAQGGTFKIPLRIWNTNECRKRYRVMKRDINLKYELCAGGEQDEDTCNGDSGGALMYSIDHGNMKVYYAVGVMVAGTVPCALQGWPNINIHVQSHLQWILGRMKL